MVYQKATVFFFLTISETLVHLSHSIYGTIISILFLLQLLLSHLFLMTCPKAPLQSSRSHHSATPAPQSPEMTMFKAVIHY